MEQSPSWEANRFSASQEIPNISWKPKVHYCIYKCHPPAPILSQLDSVHITTSRFLKIHLNIILPSTSGSPKWSVSLRIPHQNVVYSSPLTHKRFEKYQRLTSSHLLPNTIEIKIHSIKNLPLWSLTWCQCHRLRMFEKNAQRTTFQCQKRQEQNYLNKGLHNLWCSHDVVRTKEWKRLRCHEHVCSAGSAKYCCLCIIIVVYVFLLFVHVLSLSMCTYCCLCILRRGYPDWGFSVFLSRL